MNAPVPAAHQEKYAAMLRLADLFDSSAEEMRERAALGPAVLADEAVSDSAELSRPTYSEAESRILAATTGRRGLAVRSVELDADAVIVRATVLTYQWIDELQQAALDTLGSIAARAVGYLAPEVALGGAIFTAGLIETDALDRDGVATYLNELADANPELMEHFVSGGGGLLDGLRMRALLTAGVLGGSDAAAVTRGGLRAVGAPEFSGDFASCLRDIAGSFDPVETSPAEDTAPVEAPRPRSLEDLMTGLTRVEGELLVQQVDAHRFIAWLPSHDLRPNGTLRLVGGDNASRVNAVVRALESATRGVEGARVMLVGHAQGGVTAAELAAAGPRSFTIDHVVTAGAPSAHVPRIPAGTHMLALEDRADPVALLGSLINAHVANRLTVVFDGADHDGLAAYVAGGRAADSAPHPELRETIRQIQEQGYLAS